MERISTNEVQGFEREHRAALRRLAPECMLFLKRNGDFPLKEPGKVALFGSGARDTLQGGTGSGQVNVRHLVTIEEGLEKAGFEVTSRSWMFQYDYLRRKERKKWIQEISREAREKGENPALYGMGAVMPEPEYDLPLRGDGDTAIYVLARVCGEGSDRHNTEGDFRLSETEVRDILALHRKYSKFLLVLNVGGPVDLSPVEDVENVLLLSQLGMVTGEAFADVLLGKAYPSGKLSTTWAAADAYQQIGSFEEEDDTRYTEGIYVGYRYFDAAGVTPAFPFGFGLGYTDFTVRADPAKDLSVREGEIYLTAHVENTGSYPGREVVQLYYSLPEGKLDQPVKQLGVYEKTRELQAGERCDVTLHLPIEDMASYDEEKEAWILEKGTMRLWVGSSSEELAEAGGIRLERNVLIEQDKHICGKPDFTDWKPEDHKKSGWEADGQKANGQAQNEDSKGVIIDVNPEDIEGRGHFTRYRKQAESVESDMQKIDLGGFTDEELARICIGNFKKGGGISSMIGGQGARVAGSAGESADVMEARGFGKLILADGPAGLRIATDYTLGDDGAHDAGSSNVEMIKDFLPAALQKMLDLQEKQKKKKLKTQTVYHQYASSIPIGTALAQAWNPEIVRECGEIVGSEMELFGINVWLAPALNIHRSVLCGRNFEYYSEDPVLAGRTAAAMTEGVQKYPKCAVTIKHFACNDQEYNRTHNNSVLSERTLREIYLKGFEICVKEAQPHFVMSSYNLINGTHTANNRDLLTEALRREWGFEGVVMTDWFTTIDIAPSKKLRKYGNSVPSVCIEAGNDMIEPGVQQDLDQILKALNGRDPAHTLERSDLEACARRILYWGRRLELQES